MGHRGSGAAAVALACLAACGSGGGGANSGGAASEAQLTGTLQLVDQTPAEGAVQVPLDASFTLRFDGPLALECFQDEETWLRVEGGTSNVAGSFTLAHNGQGVTFRPAAPLQAETDYLLQISPLTCDAAGRILERHHQLRFRTLDTTAPTVTGASIASGAAGVDRTGAIVLTFSEALRADSVKATSVYLRDQFGLSHATDLLHSGAQVSVTPRADLPGDRGFVLAVQGGSNGVKDRAGNALGQSWTLPFRTAADATPPTVVGLWPGNGATGRSPRIQPEVRFSESMDPATVEPSSLRFQDEFGTMVPYRVRSSADQRVLRLEPQTALQPDRSYTLAFVVGPAAATDVSGNGLASTQALSFRTGSDAVAPTLTGSHPAPGEARVSPNVVPTATFAEALDPAFVNAARVRLTQGGATVSTVVELVESGTRIRITPVTPLPTSTEHTLTLQGGAEGLRDLAGNPLAQDLSWTFTTSGDATAPRLILLPADGANAVPNGARMVAVFEDPLDPASIGPATMQVLDSQDQPIAGTIALERSDRVLTFTPSQPLFVGARYTTVVRGGPGGVRERSGNWLPHDVTAGIRAGFSFDLRPPTVKVTLNRIADVRRSGLCVPPAGFTVDVEATDPVDRSLDVGAFTVDLQGPQGSMLSADALYADAAIGYVDLSYRLPLARALPPGDYSLVVRVRDLSGNEGASEPLPFRVAATSPAILPFERTQVVWVRTDLDRDGNGRTDLDDDLIRLGLQTAGDPAGTNATMRRIVLDAIYAQVYGLLGRGPRGELLGPDSVALRLSPRQPIGVPHMQIALGGLDPEGARNRRYGDSSTGVLGRAFYDHRNASLTDRNTSASPGLGVFPSEMFLYQARIHQQVYPSFQTLWAQRFLPLCPEMGGTPAGAHAEDRTVLAANFVWASASSAQRARWQQIFQAADDWAAVIGIVLAHEIGHTVGLTAPGNAPAGLFGDSSLHNQLAGATEVMAASVGYETMVTMPHSFRDVNLAYLRQRLLLP